MIEKNQFGDFIKSEIINKKFNIEGNGTIYFDKSGCVLKIKDDVNGFNVISIPYASIEI